MKSFILFFFIVSRLCCSTFYIEQMLDNTLFLSNGVQSFNKKFVVDGYNIGFDYTIYENEHSYFSLLTGFSYSFLEMYYKNNSIDYLNIQKPINTEIDIGYIYIAPKFKLSDSFSTWVSIGLSNIDINYLQLLLQYDHYKLNIDYTTCLEYKCIMYDWIDGNEVCTEYDDICLEFKQWYDQHPEYTLNDRPYFFSPNSFYAFSYVIGFDFKLSNFFTLGISKMNSSGDNIFGYNQSVFEYRDFDFNISKWKIRLGLNF